MKKITQVRFPEVGPYEADYESGVSSVLFERVNRSDVKLNDIESVYRGLDSQDFLTAGLMPRVPSIDANKDTKWRLAEVRRLLELTYPIGEYLLSLDDELSLTPAGVATFEVEHETPIWQSRRRRANDDGVRTFSAWLRTDRLESLSSEAAASKVLLNGIEVARAAGLTALRSVAVHAPGSAEITVVENELCLPDYGFNWQERQIREMAGEIYAADIYQRQIA